MSQGGWRPGGSGAVHKGDFEELRKRMVLADGRKIVVKRMENARIDSDFERSFLVRLVVQKVKIGWCLDGSSLSSSAVGVLASNPLVNWSPGYAFRLLRRRRSFNKGFLPSILKVRSPSWRKVIVVEMRRTEKRGLVVDGRLCG